MRLLIALVLVVVVAAATTNTASTLAERAPDVRKAVLFLEGGCTATFVAPTLILTASHCVREFYSYYSLGREYSLLYMGEDGGKIRLKAWLVWVSWYADEVQKLRDLEIPFPGENDGLDIALLRTADRWGSYVRIGADPEPGKRYEVWTMSFGTLYWKGVVEVLNVTEMDELGRVAVMRGLIYPGASGSLVTDSRGLARAMVTHGFVYSTPPIVFGATAKRIAWALEDYKKRGIMWFCAGGLNDKIREGEVCREKRELVEEEDS